jgi:hypothetical protein
MGLWHWLGEKSPYGVIGGAREVRAKLRGIEQIVGLLLYWLWPFFVSFWLPRYFKEDHRPTVIDVYVCVCAALTIAIWAAGPNWILLLVCSYFSLSTVFALLQVVFLTKIMGDVFSPERSLLLFIVNVVQFVFMFAGWYGYIGSLEKWDALFKSTLVLATIGYPDQNEVKSVVMLQVASNLLLFTVFLGHLIGRVGPTKNSGR